jgi:hypothetical protein
MSESAGIENLDVSGRPPLMKTSKRLQWKRIVLTSVTIGVLGLGYSPAEAVEREGTTLFFSFQELQDALRFPSFSKFSLGTGSYLGTTSYLRPDWRERDSQAGKDFRWGPGLGVDGCVVPGPCRPLWGY